MLTALTYLLVFVEIVTCLLLLGAILLQRSKDGGLGGMAFGAGMGESLFGARVGNVLTRTTVILAVIFLVTTTLLARLGAGRRSRSVVDNIQPGRAAASAPATPNMPAPMAAPMPAPVEVPAQGPGPIIPAPVEVDK